MDNLLKFRLSLMVFMEYAVWGTYLISIGMFLASVGLGGRIGWFFAAQGITSLFMPALCGIIADRYVRADRLLSLCHLLSALFMGVAALSCSKGEYAFSQIFVPFSMGVLFFVPTISLSNTVCFKLIEGEERDSAVDFPHIRVWGTVGFICSMWAVNFMGISTSYLQLVFRTVAGLVMAIYCLSLPACGRAGKSIGQGLASVMGYKGFQLFRRREMALFFLLSMGFGVCLHISNGFAGPFLDSFALDEKYAGSLLVGNSMFVLSLSQISEALCVLLIPFSLRKLGVKRVFLIAALAWMVRYILLAYGNPGGGAWMLILSMVMYGLAFDFFNVASSIYVDKNTSPERRASAQGVLVMMTSGFGASVGMISVQYVVNLFTFSQSVGGRFYTLGNWRGAWLVFAAFALLLYILMMLFFREIKGFDDGREQKS
ncbi:MAG: MFS transporter [Bacteroidaceae bacterium]|nr:MFS transporter [Bacteroidaceae bacterium]